MFFERMSIPGLAINSYIVGDQISKSCAVIDPTRDVDDFIQIANKAGLEIKYILETHVHADFVSGSKELKTRLNNKPQIACSAMGGNEWIPQYADIKIDNGHELELGTIILKALHTPGHTPEHISWLLYDEKKNKKEPTTLFSGDFLFVGSIGRPDLLGEKARQQLAKELFRSVFEIAVNLPDSLEIYPNHGAGSLCGKGISSNESSTIGNEKKYNPAFERRDESSWISNILKGMPPAPPYFSRMKKINITGAPILGEYLPGNKSFYANEFQNSSNDGIILDTRQKELFAENHIPNSINIPVSDNLSTWAGWLLPADKPIFLVLERNEDLKNVQLSLLRVGFDNIKGYLKDGISSWKNLNPPLSSLKTVSVQELNTMIEKKYNNFYILDVRTDSEWQSGHIKEAHHIHAGHILNRIKEIPNNKQIIVTCGSGYRASIIASILKREGFKDVSNLTGGMTSWKNENLPLNIVAVAPSYSNQQPLCGSTQ